MPSSCRLSTFLAQLSLGARQPQIAKGNWENNALDHSSLLLIKAVLLSGPNAFKER